MFDVVTMVPVGRWPPTRPPSFRVDSAFLSLCSPSPRSSAPPLMNSSAHLLSSTSTLTPTTGAILVEKRSLSKHGEPHQIDLSTSAPLSTPCSESRPICISTQCQRILNLLPLTPWHIVNSPWGSQKQPSWVPRLHATVSFTTFRNEAVEMHGRFLCWRKREWNWEPWPVHPPQIDQTLLLYLHKPPAEMVYHKYRVKPSSAMWYTVKNACNFNCKRC